jgi:hypothetical protein
LSDKAGSDEGAQFFGRAQGGDQPDDRLQQEEEVWRSAACQDEVGQAARGRKRAAIGPLSRYAPVPDVRCSFCGEYFGDVLPRVLQGGPTFGIGSNKAGLRLSLGKVGCNDNTDDFPPDKTPTLTRIGAAAIEIQETRLP